MAIKEERRAVKTAHDALNRKDILILHQLDVDARQPATIIGKKTRLSPDIVAYRIRKMEEEGIIQGYYTATNVYKLGHYLYKVFLSLDMTASKKEEMIHHLKRISEIGLISTTGGPYDLMIGIIGKTNLSCDQVIDKVLEKYGHAIRVKDVSVITDLHQYSKKFLNPAPLEWVFRPDDHPVELDHLDRSILARLTEHARESTVAIAQAINAERKLVSTRIKRMEREGIILGYRVVLNRQHFPQAFFRMLIKLKSYDAKKQKLFFSFLMHHPDTIYAIKSMGA